MEAWHESKRNAKLASQMLRRKGLKMSPGAVNMGITRLRKLRAMLWATLGAMKPYTDDLRPRKLTIWDEFAETDATKDEAPQPTEEAASQSG